MKAHYRTQSGRLTFELEGDGKEIFKGIAHIQEVYEADTACGHCESTNIRFRVRTAKGIDFYELVCLDCRAALSFGKTRLGDELFAKRRDDNTDEWLPNRGWMIWGHPRKAVTEAVKSESIG